MVGKIHLISIPVSKNPITQNIYEVKREICSICGYEIIPLKLSLQTLVKLKQFGIEGKVKIYSYKIYEHRLDKFEWISQHLIVIKGKKHAIVLRIFEQSNEIIHVRAYLLGNVSIERIPAEEIVELWRFLIQLPFEPVITIKHILSM